MNPELFFSDVFLASSHWHFLTPETINIDPSKFDAASIGCDQELHMIDPRITAELVKLTAKFHRPPTITEAMDHLGGDRNKVHAALKVHRQAYEAAQRAAHQVLLDNVASLLKQTTQQLKAITTLQQAVTSQQQDISTLRDQHRASQEQHTVTTRRLWREVTNLRLGLALLADLLPVDRQHQAAPLLRLLRSGEFTVVRRRVAEGDQAVLAPLRTAATATAAIEEIAKREASATTVPSMVRQCPLPPQPPAQSVTTMVRSAPRPVVAAGGR